MLGRFFSERDLALLLDLASYSIVEESNVAQHYPDYAYNHPLYSSHMKIYSDATVSDFFKGITKDKSTGFLNEWNAKRNRSERIYDENGVFLYPEENCYMIDVKVALEGLNGEETRGLKAAVKYVKEHDIGMTEEQIQGAMHM